MGPRGQKSYFFRAECDSDQVWPSLLFGLPYIMFPEWRVVINRGCRVFPKISKMGE